MKLLIYVILFLQISVFSVFAQRGDCRVVKNKSAIKLYNKAYVLPDIKHKEALKFLNQALEVDKNYTDAHYKIGEILYKLAQKYDEHKKDSLKANYYLNSAVQSFLKVIELCPPHNYYNTFYVLGKIYYLKEDYFEAKQFLETFLEHNNENSENYEAAEKMLKHINNYFRLINNPVPFNPKPLANVCSRDDEYLPLMSPDEEILMFSRRKNTAYGKSVENIIISERDWSDSSVYRFTIGTPMKLPFNDGRIQGASTITIDNQHIFITICEYNRVSHTSVKNCDIFTSDNENGKWSPLHRMSSNINGNNSFEGMPSITADGKVLFFASARKGGYGGIDIYKSEKDDNGVWGKAQNLGPVINTQGDDKTPFIHSDSQTLYFASNGRFGMGGFDLFYSQYKGLMQWAEPENIGYPINTKNDELGLVVSADGKRIFFSSKSYNKDGNWDIYTAKLHKRIRPKRVLLVKGNITDKSGNDLSNVKVNLTSIESKQRATGMVNAFTGKYAVAIPIIQNSNYLLTLYKDKYIFDSKLINPDDQEYTPPTHIDFKLGSVEEEKAFRLNYVNFRYGSHKLDKLCRLSINLLVEFMKQQANVDITLRGHTDNKGDPEFNLALSKLRVQAVRKYLITQGISSKRVSYRWFGETKPLKPNTSEAGRAVNRRVEFIIRKRNIKN